MKSREEAVLETLRGVQRFLDDNSALLDGVSSSGARKDLDDIVAQLLGHAVNQVGGHRTSQAETAKQQQLRFALRFDHMRPIAEIARQKLRQQPEFTKLSLPPDKFKGAKLTTAARDMANAAQTYNDVFVQAGLAADFVAQLRTAADRLDESIGVRGQSQQQRGGATTGLETETTRARAAIRVLDSLVRPKLGSNASLLREWDIAKHIHRARTTVSAPSTSQPSAATTPTATPSTATPPTATPSTAVPSNSVTTATA
jgi:hypothetical protein